MGEGVNANHPSPRDSCSLGDKAEGHLSVKGRVQWALPLAGAQGVSGPPRSQLGGQSLDTSHPIHVKRLERSNHSSCSFRSSFKKKMVMK